MCIFKFKDIINYLPQAVHEQSRSPVWIFASVDLHVSRLWRWWKRFPTVWIAIRVFTWIFCVLLNLQILKMIYH